jgi:hypothetical protein
MSNDDFAVRVEHHVSIPFLLFSIAATLVIGVIGGEVLCGYRNAQSNIVPQHAATPQSTDNSTNNSVAEPRIIWTPTDAAEWVASYGEREDTYTYSSSTSSWTAVCSTGSNSFYTTPMPTNGTSYIYFNGASK